MGGRRQPEHRSAGQRRNPERFRLPIWWEAIGRRSGALRSKATFLLRIRNVSGEPSGRGSVLHRTMGIDGRFERRSVMELFVGCGGRLQAMNVIFIIGASHLRECEETPSHLGRTPLAGPADRI